MVPCICFCDDDDFEMGMGLQIFFVVLPCIDLSRSYDGLFRVWEFLYSIGTGLGLG